MNQLLQATDRGLYCAQGDFYVDPRCPVRRAVVTHAHSDHARWGSEHYLAARPSEHLLRMRLQPDAQFQFLNYGESLDVNGVRLSFHPAGHILGSAQVRIEYRGHVAVVTGDYKLGTDPTCESWEPVKCNLLVTEYTFRLPVFGRFDFEDLMAGSLCNSSLLECQLLQLRHVYKRADLFVGTLCILLKPQVFQLGPSCYFFKDICVIKSSLFSVKWVTGVGKI